MGRILAIDYGLRRTGLAWTDPQQNVALPLEGVETAQLWQKIEQLLGEVEKIVIGYPRRLDGRPTEMTAPVERLYHQLRQKYPTISIELVEERLSTHAATHYLRQLPRKIRQDKAAADRIAATILLENYLLRKKP